MLDQPLKLALFEIVILSGIPLIASSLFGLVVGIFQAVTQIQEQSISFLVRLSAVGGVCFLLSNWYEDRLITLLRESFGSLLFLGE